MRHPIVPQQSEQDCGAACLATIAQYYGRTFTVDHMGELAGTRSSGTTLLGLSQGAESLGFHTRHGKATAQMIKHLHEIPLPAIIHWQGNHWVVLYQQTHGKRYVVADPSLGLRYLTHQELLAGWSNGTMLLLVPDESHFCELTASN
jgi:ABC-type bacteriocin/lantibiotic exporter with double-glycine peptidase domain